MVKEIVPVILLICIVQSIGFQGSMIKKLVIALLSQSSNNRNRQSIIDAVKHGFAKGGKYAFTDVVFPPQI